MTFTRQRFIVGGRQVFVLTWKEDVLIEEESKELYGAKFEGRPIPVVNGRPSETEAVYELLKYL